jgi:hypothetical protein
MREAITLGHNGEAKASRLAFQTLTSFKQGEILEFLKSLQILPRGLPVWWSTSACTACPAIDRTMLRGRRRQRRKVSWMT